MRYKAYLLLIILLWAGCKTALAEEQHFRVELLVLRHLNGSSQLTPQTTLRDFSAAVDLLAPPPAEMDEAAAPEEEMPAADAVGTETEGLQEIAITDESPADEPEPRIVLLETKSEAMMRAWKRLRLSANFRPELYLSWEQVDEAPYPSIRLHDAELLMEYDPYTELRLQARHIRGPDGAATDDDSATEIMSGTGSADRLSTDAGHNPSLDDDTMEATLPGPIRFYRIDGTARLRKSRFLHLDLDIELRESVSGGADPDTPDTTSNPSADQRPEGSPFLVHTLQQSRQVQTEDMEYFDGPVLGVLALISRVEVPDEESAPDDSSND